MIPEEEVAAYADEVLDSLLAVRPVEDTALLQRVRDCVRLSLQRLNDLPPDDPFWDQTNRRPTVYKASEWEARRLAAHPRDESAAWAVASFTLLHCAYGAEQALLHLPPEDPRTIRWITAASEWVSMNSGPDMAEALRTAITALPNAPESLEALRSSADPLDQRAATVCASVLAGSTVGKAVRSADRR